MEGSETGGGGRCMEELWKEGNEAWRVAPCFAAERRCVSGAILSG